MDEFIKNLPIAQPTNTAANPGNKLAYLLSVEDPSSKSKIKYYVITKFVQNTSFIDVTGVELKDKAEAESIKIGSDVQEILKGDKVNIYFPWNRVVSIKNINYNK